jgi:two-component system sporulation sensor kinase B
LANFFEPLLINFSIIMIVLFIFQIFWVDKGHLHHKHTTTVIAFLLALSIVLGMEYPIRFAPGFIFDLRYLPFILGFLYGGYRVGIPLLIVLVFYRFYIGGDGAYVNAVVAGLFVLLFPLFREKYNELNFKYKILFTMIISLVVSTLVMAFSLQLLGLPSTSLIVLSVQYIFAHSICMGLLTYISETMVQNVKFKEKIILAEKLNVVSQLSASISHEIRNPLTVTKGFLQLLRCPDIPFEKRKSYIELSLTELERAEIIINDYLAMTKSQKANFVFSNFEDDLKYVANVIKPFADIHQVDLQTSFCNELYVKYDQNQFRQCMINMTKNSIEAMSLSGGILKIALSSSKNTVIIAIEDNGVGMTKEEVARLGTPYFTTKDKGTGLGMTVAYSAIKAMKGAVKIKTNKGKGTVFTIEIPAKIKAKGTA